MLWNEKKPGQANISKSRLQPWYFCVKICHKRRGYVGDRAVRGCNTEQRHLLQAMMRELCRIPGGDDIKAFVKLIKPGKCERGVCGLIAFYWRERERHVNFESF